MQLQLLISLPLLFLIVFIPTRHTVGRFIFPRQPTEILLQFFFGYLGEKHRIGDRLHHLFAPQHLLVPTGYFIDKLVDQYILLNESRVIHCC